MRFYVITALLIAAVTAAAASLGYLCLRSHDSTPAPADALTWLRTEFDLSPEQLARIKQSHAAYSVVCAEHCDLIRQQRATVAALQATQAPQSQLEAAQQKSREIDAHCTASVESHVREIAALIGGEQGQRYLREVLPRLAHFDHATAPDLMLSDTGQTAPACATHATAPDRMLRSTPADASPACH